jgi:hypothetical protein
VRLHRLPSFSLQGKAYICCTIHGAASDVWIPWTVTGSLGLAFALLASARVVWHTLVVPPPPGKHRCARCCARWCCCWCCCRGGSRKRQLEAVAAYPAGAAARDRDAEEELDAACSMPADKTLFKSSDGWKAGSEGSGLASSLDGPTTARSDWRLSAGPPVTATMHRNHLYEL